jgi:hypothetical protein
MRCFFLPATLYAFLAYIFDILLIILFFVQLSAVCFQSGSRRFPVYIPFKLAWLN